MDVSIIIINWNSREYLKQCLESIYRETSGLAFEVIIIDNASFDGTAEMLAADFPQARFIQSSENLGFARGNALGAAQARGKYFLFLNPDTVMHPQAIQRLHEAMMALPDAGVVGARLLNSDGTLQRSCVQAFPTIANQVLDANALRRLFPHARMWGTEAFYSKSREPIPAQGISGACLMTPRGVFEQVGGFSETYFMYYEDMDYCLKARKTGRQNYFVPLAEVVHHGGKSSAEAVSKFSSVMMAESAWRFFSKQHGVRLAGVFRSCLGAVAVSRFCALALAYPLSWQKARRQRVRNGFRKWVWVARWAFGIEPWVREY